MQRLASTVSDQMLPPKSLQESEARFRSYFELPLIGFAVTNPESAWIAVNDRFCEMLGYSREELAQTDWARLTHPSDLAADVRQFNRILSGEIENYSLEKRFIRKDGNIIWANIAVGCVRKADGTTDVLCGYVQDITEHKFADEQLKTSEERFRKAFMTGADAFYLATLKDGRCIESNDRFNELFGYAREEVLGKTPLELGLYANPEDRRKVMTEVESRGFVRDVELKGRTKDGKSITGLLSINLLEGGEEQLILGAVKDITKQRLLEEQLRQAQKMEVLGQLAGSVAHDFNNLLSVIIGYSELASGEWTSGGRTASHLDTIKQAAQRAASLTAQLLAFSRRHVVAPKVLNLNTLVRETEKMLRRLLGEDIEQKSFLDPALGKAKADPGQMVQVIMNLAVNARDAMPHGGKLTIETTNITLAELTNIQGVDVLAGPYVRLAVSDTGEGINQETMSCMFEPFFTTKGPGKGTGLGLATVYSIVKQSGGYVFAESGSEKGATFNVYLPCIDQPEAVSVPVTPRHRQKRSETILVVEDEPAFRNLLLEGLQTQGYRVLVAANGIEALQVAESHTGRIDLLVTDVIMPQMSGPELAKCLRASRSDIEILYMTGYTDDKVKVVSSVDELRLIQKPFRIQELGWRMEEILTRKAVDGTRRNPATSSADDVSGTINPRMKQNFSAPRLTGLKSPDSSK